MLEIYPIQDKASQEDILNKCNIEFDADKLAYSAYVDEKLAGALQFAIKGNAGYIYDIENADGTNDEEALFVMGRACLNFIDLCGVHTAFFEARDEGRELLVKKIGFKKNSDGKWEMNLEGFFEAPCKHCSD